MKTVALILLAMFMGVSASMAQVGGGFDGPRAPSLASMTVQQALDMPDDTIVVVTGHIVNSLGDEKYLFRDETGEVVIEIDNEDWRGQVVKPEDTIEIVGELDKEFFDRTKIDVKSFTIK